MENSIESEHPANYITSSACGIFGTIGFSANLFALTIICKGRLKNLKPHELIIVGICVSDLMFSLSNIFEAYYIIHFHSIGCRINGFFDYIFGSSSFILPCLAMLNRYFSLYNQPMLKVAFTRKKVVAYLCLNLIWFHVIFIPYITNEALGLDDLGLCGIQLKTTFLKMWFQIDIICIMLAYCVSVFCGFNVLRKIRNHKNGVSIEFESKFIEESGEIATLMIMLLVIPLFCQVPAVVLKTVQCFVMFNPWVSRICMFAFPTTATVSPFLILWKVKVHREKVQQFFAGNKVTPSRSEQ